MVGTCTCKHEKINVFKGINTTQHITVCSQAETTLTFLAGEKDTAEAETVSSEDGVTWFGTWGTPHHKGEYRQLQHRSTLHTGRASSAREGCYTEALDEGGLKKCRLLCLSESHLML